MDAYNSSKSDTLVSFGDALLRGDKWASSVLSGHYKLIPLVTQKY